MAKVSPKELISAYNSGERNLSSMVLSEGTYLDLRKANLKGVNLGGANLERTDLRGANCVGANFFNASFDENTKLEGMLIDDGRGNEYFLK